MAHRPAPTGTLPFGLASYVRNATEGVLFRPERRYLTFRSDAELALCMFSPVPPKSGHRRSLPPPPLGATNRSEQPRSLAPSAATRSCGDRRWNSSPRQEAVRASAVGDPATAAGLRYRRAAVARPFSGSHGEVHARTGTIPVSGAFRLHADSSGVCASSWAWRGRRSGRCGYVLHGHHRISRRAAEIRRQPARTDQMERARRLEGR